MTSISSSAQVTTGAARRRGATMAGPVTRLNSIAGWSMFALVALAPVPLGSNRPFFWALWVAMAGAVGLWFFVSVKLADEEFRVPVAEMRGLVAGFLLVLLAMLVQVLPLGELVAITFDNQFGETVQSATLSVAPGETLLAMLRWGTYGLVFFLLLQASVQERRSRLLLRGLLAVAVVQAAYALIALSQLGDTILLFDKSYYRGVATGTFVNRNSLATFLGMGIVLATALATRSAANGASRAGNGASRAGNGQPRQPKVDRMRLVLLAASIFLMFAALVATQSRMGLLATMGGVVAVLLLRPVGSLAITAGLIAVGAALVAFLYGSGIAERFLATEASADYRMTLYRQVVDMILQRPLLGYGAGTFALAFPPLHGPSLDMSVTWDHAHSTYLALWAGLGLVVGTIPLLLVATIVVRIFTGSARRARLSVESTAAVGATVTVALHSLVDFSLEIQGVALFYTAVLAIGAARPLSTALRAQP